MSFLEFFQSTLPICPLPQQETCTLEDQPSLTSELAPLTLGSKERQTPAPIFAKVSCVAEEDFLDVSALALDILDTESPPSPINLAPAGSGFSEREKILR
tara:strand:- start:576 stop:875 length:300 start_codon:yes stop_codon:yes gene_type:complete